MQFNSKALDSSARRIVTAVDGALFKLTVVATCQTLTRTPADVSKFKKSLIDFKQGAKSTVDLSYTLAKLLAPRVSEVAKEGVDHDSALALVTDHVRTLKHTMGWQEFKRWLQTGQTDAERATAQGQEQANAELAAEVAEVEEIDTLAPSPQHKADLREEIALATILAAIEALTDSADLAKVIEAANARALALAPVQDELDLAA